VAESVTGGSVPQQRRRVVADGELQRALHDSKRGRGLGGAGRLKRMHGGRGGDGAY
jgi:hypothetical protein